MLEKLLTPEILSTLSNIVQSNDFCVWGGSNTNAGAIVHYRSFLNEPWVTKEVHPEDFQSPLILIGSDGDKLWQEYGNIPQEEVFLVKVDLFNQVEWLNGGEIPEKVRAATAKLTLNPSSHTPIVQPEVKFPYKTEVELFATPQKQYLSIAIETSTIPSQWERVYAVELSPTGGSNAKSLQKALTIEAIPQWGETQFQATIEGIELSQVPLPSKRVAKEDSSDIHLFLIFDRTTLDKESWLEARTHSKNFQQEEKKEKGRTNELAPETNSAPTNNLNPTEWNQQLRDSIAREMKSLISKFDLIGKFTICWFADYIPSGWIDMDGLITEGEGKPWKTSNTRNLNNWNEDVLKTYTYHPGMDLYDPVEEAIFLAQKAIEQKKIKEACILIIGNSPPTMPMDPEDPLRQLVEGPPSSNVRDTSALWRHCLHEISLANIPLCYLFLQLSDAPISEKTPRGLKSRYNELKNSYENFEAKLAQYLEQSIEYNAKSYGHFVSIDPDDMQQGLEDSFQWLLERLKTKPDRLWISINEANYETSHY